MESVVKGRTWQKLERSLNVIGAKLARPGPQGAHPTRELTTTKLANATSTWGEGTDRLVQMSWMDSKALSTTRS